MKKKIEKKSLKVENKRRLFRRTVILVAFLEDKCVQNSKA